MKFWLASFFLAGFALSQDPSTCDTTDKARDGSDFILEDQGVNANLAPLSDIFAKAGKKVTVADVFNDGNHKLTSASDGMRAWEEKPDFDDQNTSKWMPQGITSTADALGEGTYEGVDGIIASWYRTDDKAVRVSFVNKKDWSYRHVLLVYPDAEDDFKDVPVHAGGLMWYGNTLWVVDTSNGIRVFDMDNIWQVEGGDGTGKNSDGTYSAAGYKYVLPQIRWYKWTPDFEFRFSYISLDRTATPDRVMVGEYQSDTSLPIRMAQWDLDYTKRGLASASGVWAYCVGIRSIQGAVEADGKFYISRSNGKNGKGDIFGWTPGGPAKENTGIVPRGTEDLSFDGRDGTVLGLTEYAGDRYLYFLDAGDIKFS